jgi:anti-sigma factor RsiW
MTCEDSRLYLSAYLDDELDVTRNLRIQSHLASCAACRKAQDEQLALRSALRDPELRAQPSAEFQNRVRQAVHQAAKTEARLNSPWRQVFRIDSFRYVGAAAALALVITIAVVLFSGSLRSSESRQIASAVMTAHLRSLQPGHLVDVTSSDRHTVKPWFQGKLDFSPAVPDLGALGFNLIGGRLDYVGGRPVAAIVYQRRMHNINVFVWQKQGGAAESIPQQSVDGYQIVHWDTTDLSYWAVSDLNGAELQEFARDLRAQ